MAEVKMCGLATADAVSAACKAGARFVGFVFVPGSPRALSPHAASLLARQVPTGVRTVGLFCDRTPADIQAILNEVPLDMVQLHGHESPGDVHAVRQAVGIPVIKAIRVATSADLDQTDGYEAAADWLLFDARSDKALGGTGHRFDWSLLEGRSWRKPWMLAGGLDAENVGEAIARLHPSAVDVSSGIEAGPGFKDPCKIRAFMEAVHHANKS